MVNLSVLGFFWILCGALRRSCWVIHQKLLRLGLVLNIPILQWPRSKKSTTPLPNPKPRGIMAPPDSSSLSITFSFSSSSDSFASSFSKFSAFDFILQMRQVSSCIPTSFFHQSSSSRFEFSLVLIIVSEQEIVDGPTPLCYFMLFANVMLLQSTPSTYLFIFLYY